MVLSMARARRLARTATRRRPYGTSGWRARRAWRTLTGAAEHGDPHAATFLWKAWLRDPADELWPVVSRGHTPADVFAAATDPARDAAERAALGAFCARHDLTPDNDVECAVFFVLTGGHERYRALDPDGTLLAGGYHGAAEATREALRHTMIGLGELEVVRVIADRPGRPLTEDEAGYVADRLARDGAWRELWRLVPTVPLTAAARVVRRFGDWRPPDDAGRALFAKLSGTDPDVVPALTRAAVTRVDIAGTSEVSFSPDNTELAVTHRSGTTVVTLPGGHPVASHDGKGQRSVLAFGAGTIVYRGTEPDDWAIIRRTPGRPREVLLADKPGAMIGRTPDGFAVVSRGDGIWLGTPGGTWSREVHGPGLPVAVPGSMLLVAADPASGQLAISEVGSLVLVDANLTVLARGKLAPYEFVRGTFVAPGHLVTRGLGDQSLVSWRVDGTDLVRVATHYAGEDFPVPVPGHDDRVILMRSYGTVWLDTATFTATGAPFGFPWLGGAALAFSRDGSLAAVTRRGNVEVHDMAVHHLAALAGKAIVELGLSDLETLGLLGKQPPVTDALDLVRAGLEYRFGADIALGTGDRRPAGQHDIALGGGA
jgi:hypothetical protein